MVKFLKFWQHNLRPCFQHIEAQFQIKGIMQNVTKYVQMVAPVNTSTTARVMLLLEAPPAISKGDALRTIQFLFLFFSYDQIHIQPTSTGRLQHSVQHTASTTDRHHGRYTPLPPYGRCKWHTHTYQWLQVCESVFLTPFWPELCYLSRCWPWNFCVHIIYVTNCRFIDAICLATPARLESSGLPPLIVLCPSVLLMFLSPFRHPAMAYPSSMCPTRPTVSQGRLRPLHTPPLPPTSAPPYEPHFHVVKPRTKNFVRYLGV